MTNDRIQHLQQNFVKLLSVSDQAGRIFYQRLFELDPSTKPLFKADMQEMTRQLMQTVGMIVTGVSTPHQIMGLVAEHGRKHVEYGVVEGHYETVRAALLWTLGQILGPEFNSETQAAWTEAYELIAKVMKDAGRDSGTVSNF
jgi:hemoglobin-like flavoprotein